MTSHRLLPTLTEKRLEWLHLLERSGVANRYRAVTGYQTMTLGWTQWAFTDGKETITEEEFDRRFPMPADPRSAGRVLAEGPSPAHAARIAARETWKICGETLTDEGRNILKTQRAA